MYLPDARISTRMLFIERFKRTHWFVNDPLSCKTNHPLYNFVRLHNLWSLQIQIKHFCTSHVFYNL